MNKLLTRPGSFCYFLVLACVITSAGALESDRLQKIEFSSDGGATMTLRGEVRIMEWKDNVSVSQGSLQIEGNTAIVEYKVGANDFNRVTVHGSPVRYQQQLDESGSVVVGSSDTLLFYTDTVNGETVLELIGNASIQSPDSRMACAAIIYLADQELIRETTGPCAGSLNSRSN